MARVTVEDCLENVDNRFSLVLVAARRARQLSQTPAEPLVARGADKCTVLALREIAANLVTKEVMDEVDKKFQHSDSSSYKDFDATEL